MATSQLVLVRHGESQWNRENRFTGWTDVDLTEKGEAEAREAGKLTRELMDQTGLEFDGTYTSLLQRAIRTHWVMLNEMERSWLPVERSWRLNERHYGALQGLNKAETTDEYGKEQVHIWRRSFATPPPELEPHDERNPRKDPRYRSLTDHEIPLTESLEMTVKRFMPMWSEVIAPRLAKGENLLIVAHGNSLRALIKHLDGLSDEAIAEVNIPTGIPLAYEIDCSSLQPVHKGYLGDSQAAAQAAAAVAQQANSSK